MNDVCEMWSLPWHALQRSLARDIGADAASYCAPARKAANARPLALPANSWLSRVQHRPSPAVHVRQ